MQQTEANHPRRVVGSIAVLLIGGMLFAGGEPADAQLPKEFETSGDICRVVFASGELSVEMWMDDEPLLVVGEFNMVIERTSDFLSLLDEDLEDADWMDALFYLIAFPGSDAPLPGGLSWAPCSSSWEIGPAPGRKKKHKIESICESMLVPEGEPDGRYYELFVREDITWMQYHPTPGSGRLGYNCGRLYMNGVWDSVEDTGVVDVTGKICECD